MFVPIDQILAPSQRDHLIIQPTSLASPPPAVHHRRMRKAEEAPKAPDELLKAERSYQQVRHMAYLSVIQEAYRNFTVES